MLEPQRTIPDQFPLLANALGNFYRHVGTAGVIQVLSRGKETETGVEMVASMSTASPFEPTLVVPHGANFDEMTDGARRFTPITVAEAEKMMSADRTVAQAAVTAARAARRAAR